LLAMFPSLHRLAPDGARGEQRPARSERGAEP
jgi:hypothetical protein